VNDNDWKEYIGLAFLILAICFGLATCRYAEHRIELERGVAVGGAK
jgi:hypothetical protein